MGLTLTHLIGKQYDEAEKELDELNSLLESKSDDADSTTKIAIPAISIFTILCYYDIIQRGYPVSGEKWTKAAGEINSLAAHNDKGIEKRIQNWLLPNVQNRESGYQIIDYIQKKEIDKNPNSLFGSLFTPIVYELQRIG